MSRQIDAAERQAMTSRPDEGHKLSQEGNTIAAPICKPENTAAKHLPAFELYDNTKKVCTAQNMDFSPINKNGGEPTKRSDDILKDKNASPEERLKAAHDLAKQGVREVHARAADGHDMTLKIGTIKAGANEMVHVTMQDRNASGVLLKGIVDSSGNISHQKDRRGHEADYYGSASRSYNRNIAGDSTPGRTDGRNDSQMQQSDRPPQEKTKPAQEKDKPLENKDKPDQSAEPSRADIYQHYRRLEEARKLAAGDKGEPVRANASLHAIMDQAAFDARHRIGNVTPTNHGVYMRGRFAVDADGSPRAREIDPHGDTKTSLRYADGRRGSINAEEVPYIVMPKGEFAKHGLNLGDMALVRNKENGRLSVAVFADAGPSHKRGEGSMALASELGLNRNPNHGGSQRPNFEYLVLPGSGQPARNQEELMARIKSYREKLGLQ